jgi:sulfur carrier protein ThiS|tara:strand:+ start:305 stop:514 length:210 start_codon:yes stop_codon:yes gene_type:complete
MVKITVYIERDDKEVKVTLEKNPTISHLLANLDINPVSVIVTKNNEVCTEDQKIDSKDQIKIISVVSGG